MSRWLAPLVVARRLGISRRSVYRLIELGAFPHAVRVLARAWRIPEGDVDAWIASHGHSGHSDH